MIYRTDRHRLLSVSVTLLHDVDIRHNWHDVTGGWVRLHWRLAGELASFADGYSHIFALSCSSDQTARSVDSHQAMCTWGTASHSCQENVYSIRAALGQVCVTWNMTLDRVLWLRCVRVWCPSVSCWGGEKKPDIQQGQLQTDVLEALLVRGQVGTQVKRSKTVKEKIAVQVSRSVPRRH